MDGRREEIPLSELSQYVTETANPKNKKGVKEVLIYYPSLLLKEGVILVDIPGIGSIHENNTQITKRYLKYADVAVFVLAVYPPMTKEEVDFLTTVKEITDKMISVLNKVDTVSDNEQQEILDFSTKLIQEEIGMEKAIVYPLTAKKALKESFFANKQHQQFIQDLEKADSGKKRRNYHSFYPKLELASFSPLLPSSMRNNVIRKKIREEVITQVDKNCGRMRYDFSYRISETAKLFIYRWENEVEKLITRIKNIVNKAREEKRKNIQAVEIRAKELQDDLIKIKNLITEFKTN